jgi:hypothetical protein
LRCVGDFADEGGVAVYQCGDEGEGWGFLGGFLGGDAVWERGACHGGMFGAEMGVLKNGVGGGVEVSSYGLLGFGAVDGGSMRTALLTALSYRRK